MSRADDHAELAALADRFEPQLEAEYERAAKRMHAGVKLDRLTLALAKGDVEAAVRATITDKGLRDAMAPVKTMIKSTALRGGKLGAKQINKLP